MISFSSVIVHALWVFITSQMLSAPFPSFLRPFAGSAKISAVNWVLEELFSNTPWRPGAVHTSQFKDYISLLREFKTAYCIEADVFCFLCPSSDSAEPLTQKSFFGTEAALHSLLGALTSLTYNDPTQHLEREQALAKQFAEILHFTLRFDELKVRRSFLQRIPSVSCCI